MKDWRKIKWQTKNKQEEIEIIKMMISIQSLEKQEKKFVHYAMTKTLNKNAEQLKKFINEKGKILPRRATGACAKHQRFITTAVKRGRHIAVIPYSQD